MSDINTSDIITIHIQIGLWNRPNWITIFIKVKLCWPVAERVVRETKHLPLAAQHSTLSTVPSLGQSPGRSITHHITGETWEHRRVSHCWFQRESSECITRLTTRQADTGTMLYLTGGHSGRPRLTRGWESRSDLTSSTRDSWTTSTLSWRTSRRTWGRRPPPWLTWVSLCLIMLGCVSRCLQHKGEN